MQNAQENDVNMPTIRPITVEATAIFKGIEMTHGNSAHYLTFELDSGERIYFQVSMKCYMLILEGDRCLVTYKSITNSPKKKLKSFERIGVKSFVSTPVEDSHANISQKTIEQEEVPIQEQESVQEQKMVPPPEASETTKPTTENMQQKLEESRKSLAALRERQIKE